MSTARPGTRGRPPTQDRHVGVPDVFAALGDPVRRHLLELVTSDGPVSATALAAQVDISRQGVTKHLDVLRGAGLVTRSRSGRETLYTASLAPLDEVSRWISRAEQQWDARLARLATTVAERHSSSSPTPPSTARPGAAR